MWGRAIAGRAEIDRAGTLLRIGDQLLHIGDRELRVHHQHDRRDREQRDRREVARRIEGQPLGVERRVDDQRTRRGEQQRVAVRFRLCDRFRADIPARPGAVLDDELLAGALGELLRQKPRHDVDRSPGRKRIDDTHHAIGIGFRLRRQRRREHGRNDDGGETEGIHSQVLPGQRLPTRLRHRPRAWKRSDVSGVSNHRRHSGAPPSTSRRVGKGALRAVPTRTAR